MTPHTCNSLQSMAGNNLKKWGPVTFKLLMIHQVFVCWRQCFLDCVCVCVCVAGNGAAGGGSALSLLCRDLSTICQPARGLCAWSFLMKTRCFPRMMLPRRTSPALSQPTLANTQRNTHTRTSLKRTLTHIHACKQTCSLFLSFSCTLLFSTQSQAAGHCLQLADTKTLFNIQVFCAFIDYKRRWPSNQLERPVPAIKMLQVYFTRLNYGAFYRYKGFAYRKKWWMNPLRPIGNTDGEDLHRSPAVLFTFLNMWVKWQKRQKRGEKFEEQFDFLFWMRKIWNH